MIKSLQDNQIVDFSEMIVMEAAAMIGQREFTKEVKLIAIKDFGTYLKKNCRGWSLKEIREALKYGCNKDKTRGGSIFAQRLIQWIDDYRHFERPKKALKSKEVSEAPKEIEQPKKGPIEIITDHYYWFKSGSMVWSPSMVLSKFYELGFEDYWTNDQKWAFIFQSVENIKAESSMSSIASIAHRNLIRECNKIEKGKRNTVPPLVKSAAIRLMIIELFSKMKTPEDLKEFLEFN